MTVHPAVSVNIIVDPLREGVDFAEIIKNFKVRRRKYEKRWLKHQKFYRII